MPNTAADLSESMSHNPNLKVLSLNGYYDFATAFFATEYDIAHMNIDKNCDLISYLNIMRQAI